MVFWNLSLLSTYKYRNNIKLEEPPRMYSLLAINDGDSNFCLDKEEAKQLKCRSAQLESPLHSGNSSHTLIMSHLPQPTGLWVVQI